MKAFILLIFGLLPLLSANAATTVSQSGTISTNIPDNDDSGATFQLQAGIGITQIESVFVSLTFSGGWNGDLYVYLAHDGALSMLLNRPGRSLLNPDGAGSSGMRVDIYDLAASDIHTALGGIGIPEGSFQPDGRVTDPLAVLETDPRTAMLSVFEGQNASGTWTLFVADQSAGEVSTLQNWSLTITSIPESYTALLISFAALPFLRRRR